MAKVYLFYEVKGGIRSVSTFNKAEKMLKKDVDNPKNYVVYDHFAVKDGYRVEFVHKSVLKGI